MCQSCITGSVSFYLNLTNLLHTIGGLVVLGYGGYMLNKEPDVVFIKGVLGLGGAVFLIGIMGILAVRNTSPCALTIYGILMFILFVANAALAIGLYAKQDAIIGDIKDDNAKSFVEDHLDIIHYSLIGLAACELFAVILSRSYRSMMELHVDRYSSFTDQSNMGNSSPEWNQTYQKSSPTKTDKHRERMVQKYGDRFRKTSNGSSVRGSAASDGNIQDGSSLL